MNVINIIFRIICVITMALCSNPLLGQDNILLTLESGELFLVNTRSCTKELVGNTDSVMLDIAINPMNQRMYGVSSSSQLFEIDVNDASIDLIGPVDIPFNGLAFSDEGILYGMTQFSNRLYRISTVTGNVTLLGDIGVSVSSAGDLNLYKDKMYLSGNSDLLVEVNLQNLQKSVIIGSTGIQQVWGTTSAGCDSKFYLGALTNLYQVDDSDFLSPVLLCPDVVPSPIYGATSLVEDISEVDLGPDRLLCGDDDEIQLNAFTTNATYEWQDGFDGPSITVTEPGQYYVTVTGGCGVSSDTVIVNREKPVDVAIKEFDVLCKGETLLLTAQPSGDFDSLLWSTGSSDRTIEVTEAGSYSVAVSGPCSVIRDSVNVTFKTLTDVSIEGSDVLCAGDSNHLTARISSDFDTLRWSNGSLDRTIEITEAGKYWVELINQCGASSDTLEVILKEPTDVSIEAPDVLCEGASVVLTARPSADFELLLWSTGSNDPSVLVSEAGLYSVELTSQCGVTTDSVDILLNESLEVFVEQSAVLCVGESIFLTGGAARYFDSLLWSTGSREQAIEVTEAGQYWLEIGENGCFERASILVESEVCPPVLELPNVFTPNGDTFNNTFTPFTVEHVKSMSTILFDRTGQKIFQTSDQHINWDGKLENGQEASEGIYFWLIDYSDFLDKGYKIRGRVTLIR